MNFERPLESWAAFIFSVEGMNSMNKTIGMTAAFLLGAAAGAASAWYILKEHYAQIAQEEIDSVKEAFSRRDKQIKDEHSEDISDEAPEEEPKRATDMVKQEASDLAEKLDYTAYSTKPAIADVVKKMEENVKHDSPYVIPDEDYGTAFDYDQIELMFFADKILADDDMEIIEDVEDIVGFEALGQLQFGVKETICVRNDRLKCEYEIVLDERTYADAMQQFKPYRKGVL